MSVATEIARIKTAVAAAYSACEAKGATMPAVANRNVANLAGTIASIPYTPPTNPYVSDGLVAWWDGEWNSGEIGEHSGTATVWTDIIGGLNLTHGGTISNKYIQYRSGQVSSQLTFSGFSIGTVEVVFVGVNSHGYSSDAAVAYFNGLALRIRSVDGRAGFGRARRYNPAYYTGAGYGDLVTATDTVDGSSELEYYNGVLLNSRSYTAAISTAIQLAAAGAPTDWQACDIYCIRMYSRALTAQEVAANYAVDQQRFGV